MVRGKSPEGGPRAPCPLQQDEPRHRHSALLPSSKPPSPPYAHERYRHHDRPCPHPPGPAPAAGQLPFRRGRPAAGGLRGGKPCLPAGNGPPEGGGAWQRLRCGSAGPVPVSLVRHGGDAGALPSGRRAAPPMPLHAAFRSTLRCRWRTADGRRPRRTQRSSPARSGAGAGHGLMRCGHGKRPPSGAGRCVPLPAGRPCRHAFFAGLRRKCLPSRLGQPALCADGQRPPLGQCPARRRPARPRLSARRPACPPTAARPQWRV